MINFCTRCAVVLMLGAGIFGFMYQLAEQLPAGPDESMIVEGTR